MGIKRTLIWIGVFIIILIGLILLISFLDETEKEEHSFYQEKCKLLNASFEPIYNPFRDSTCFRFENNVYREFILKKSQTRMGETYDNKYEYYLKEI